MPPTPPRSPLLDRYLRDYEHGNHTSIDIAAPPAVAWAALFRVGLSDCRTTRALSAVRTFPGRLARRGAYGSNPSGDDATDVPLLESMRQERFITLDEVPGEEIVLGVIGQFWKPAGGTDAGVTNATEFLAFDTPGYIKLAVNFRADATASGCTLTTETRCIATDPGAARRFSIYWALIGWASKLIRRDILAATRRRAETARDPHSDADVNDRIGSYRWRDVWPRPATGSLPPGQRVAMVMPRFSSRPAVTPPPVPERPQLEVTGDVAVPLRFDLDRLQELSRTEMVEDFHCVTTWTIPELTWAGWKLIDVWQQLIKPDAAPELKATHLRVRGADSYWAVLDLKDALGPDVMLADSLQGRPLDALHGAPLRLVSPRQYGYKSVKHVTAISVHNRAPRRYGGAIEHPRARVAFEERHSRIAGPLLRWPYRALIVPTAAIAQHSARNQS